MQKFVEYVDNHKEEIALGALCTVGAGVLIALGVKSLSSIKTDAKPVEMIGDIVSDSKDWMDRNVVEGFTTGKVNDLWNEGEYGTAIVQFFTIKDMGKLGEDLKKIKGVTDDTEVSAVLTFINTKVET
jgi:hypothetical protein